jgi:hypothetical protein
MRILVNGSSMSAFPEGWQFQLTNTLGAELINLSSTGCGYDYVHDTTIAALAKDTYDLVLIMWPAVSLRTDWKVDCADRFVNESWTSQYHADGNPNIELDWIYGGNFIVDESTSLPLEKRGAVSRLFADFYSVVKPPQLIRTSIIRIITLQSVLKTRNIPYVFMMPAPMIKHKRFGELDNMIDYTNFFNDEQIMPYCDRNALIDPVDNLHPSIQGHIEFSNLLLEHLRKNSYV